MTRDSRAWRWIGFLIALVGVGFPYWQLAPEQAGLPRALYGPGLVAVGVIAMLLRAFGTGRFLTLWLLIAAAVPVAVLVRIAMNAARGVAGTGPAAIAGTAYVAGSAAIASTTGAATGSAGNRGSATGAYQTRPTTICEATSHHSQARVRASSRGR